MSFTFIVDFTLFGTAFAKRLLLRRL